MFLGKCLKWNLNFQIWSKVLCLGVSEPTKRLAAQSAAYALLNRQGKHAFVNEKIKTLRYIDEFFFPTNDFPLVENFQLYIIAKYKTSNSYEIEAAIQKCSVKKVLLKILQNS